VLIKENASFIGFMGITTATENLNPFLKDCRIHHLWILPTQEVSRI
jgi:hypothetical protein